MPACPNISPHTVQDGDAPSYFNPQEALVLADLLASLLATRAATPAADEGSSAQGGRAHVQRAAVSVQDIGVIATYRRQVRVPRASGLAAGGAVCAGRS